ncbi:type IV pilin protein [Sphaerotilus sp.]|uniref:type IV pilin protein n=1 Tax=Sphaerotilus sp. TaxID=2093942 RepID=UPI002ACD7288|nr:type IV pilin protein [Sphaerotilus sp.]MDZ7858395.1 type IV pilin protein [Sphaerotilus sp.]
MLNTTPHPTASRGMTLVELAIALVLVAILASLAVPGWQAQVQRTRRSDAIVALAQLQQAQERWRSQRPTYAAGLGPDGLALPAISPAGHYDLSTSVAPDTAHHRYRVTAVARGPQTDDRLCRWLVLDIGAGQLHHRSGPDGQTGNLDAQNRLCWKS